MVMLMFCIILMYVYGKERRKEKIEEEERKKKRNTPLTVRGCMYACKIGVCMKVGRHVGFSPTKGHVVQ